MTDPDRRSLLASLAAIAAAGGVQGFAAAPAVRVSGGRLAGYADTGISVFKGIPYGADTGPRRFQPPRPAAPWPGVREALDHGPASPQARPPEPASEDCLRLNVWTPGLDRGRRPVMVYIHGGAYSSGSGSDPLYDGARLARRGDVVVVTLNHRLSVFGYGYLARFDRRLPDSGNAGQLDLVLALGWVRDNIAAFGGDPGRVMLFGQSGGGAKIATLMAMPAARGLFHRAATMSGQQLTASGPLNATRRMRAYLEALGLAPGRAGELRTLPVERLVEGLAATDPVIGAGGLYFGPVLDERTLTRHPFYPDAPPLSRDVPMVIGNTRDETRYFMGRSDPTTWSLTWAELPERLIPQMRVDIDPETVVAAYRRLYPHYSPTEVYFAATTASRSWRAAVVEAELRAQQGSPAFAYQLDWRAPADGGKWGAFHTLDIPLVFGTLDAPGSLTGQDERARRMSERMMDAFVAFARSGDPNHAGIPRWEPYGLDRRQTLVFDDSTRLEDDPRGAERRLFEKVPFVQQGT